MRKPISAHEFHYHVLLWFRLFNLHREQESPQGSWSHAPDPKGKAHHQGNQRHPRGQNLAKLSPALAPQELCLSSHEQLPSLERVFSPLHFMDCLSVKGEPLSIATRELLPL